MAYWLPRISAAIIMIGTMVSFVASAQALALASSQAQAAVPAQAAPSAATSAQIHTQSGESQYAQAAAAAKTANAAANPSSPGATTTQTSSSVQDDLHATIMSALLADPRTAQLPPDQLQSMVNALADQAQSQGLTAADIAWQPQRPQTLAQAPKEQQGESDCDPAFMGLCTLSDSFGFTGGDYSIPAALFITAGLLWLIIRRLHHHHTHEAKKGIAGSTPLSSASSRPNQ